jgi:hypothetical protein
MAGTGWGQDRLSAISGGVSDESGASIAGAAVEAVQRETGRRRKTVTGDDGLYRFDRLELGTYTVTAAKDGFQLSRHENVTLAVDRAAVVDHRLRVGSREESVVITGEARLIEASPSALTSLVEGGTIEQLPLNGRDFMQLAAVQAGAPVARAVDRDVNTGYGMQISISGSRPFQNSFRVDGLQMTSYNGATPGSINGVNLGADAIAEFSVHGSAFGAQAGQAAGGVINAVTRSGTNDWHGAGFYFHRNDNLDARNFFDGEKKPEFRRHQFGASLGGPIRRNRTFFFANAESFREQRGNTTINTTLGAAAREGRLLSGTVRVDPAIAKVLPFYPLANGETFGDAGLYSFANNVTGNQNFVTGRVDHNASERDKLFFRVSRDIGTRTNQTDFGVGERPNGTRQHTAVLEHSRILSAAAMNSARVGFLRSSTVFGQTLTRLPGTDSRDLAYTPESGVLGLIVVAGLTDHPGGSGALGGDRHVLNSFQVSDDVQVTRGRHHFRTGARLERTQFNTDSQVRPVGEYRFRNIANFLTNVPERFRGMYPGADTVRGHRQWIGALYLEDSWRVSGRVTIDMGVRWEWATVPTEVNGKVANMDRLTDTALRVGDPLFANPSWTNVVPRVGAAWDVTGTGRTLVRGGFGFFPDLILSPYILLSGVRNPPFFVRGEYRALAPGDFPKRGYEKLASTPAQDQGAERIVFDISQPMVRHWNVNLEQRLARRLTARAAYVGSRGTNLSNVVTDANTARPEIQADGRVYFPAGGSVINPKFGVIRNRRFDADSFYHGLQTWLTQKFDRGLQLQLTYTFSKSLDDSSNFSSSNEAVNRGLLPYDGSARLNRGRSGHDVRHYMTFTGYWELPWRGLARGWQVGGIATYASGTPTTAWLGYDAARTLSHQTGANMAQRPDLAPGASPNPVTGDPNRWVDIEAFRRPTAGYLGNLGRNTITGPDTANVDLSVVRRFRPRWLGESGAMDFRFEFFNILNRTNFNLPALERMETFYESAPRGDFARITSADQSREIQLGFRFRF